ncbi:Cyanovirin-N [Naviculisporaceae sp. PSN 640]
MQSPASLRSLLMAAAVMASSAMGAATPVSAAETAPSASVFPSPPSAEHVVYLATGETVAPEDAPPIIDGDVFASEETSPNSKRSFINSCKNCVAAADWVGCYCRTANGNDVWTQLDLDNCLVNNRGKLEWRRNGGFSSTCSDVYWMPPSRISVGACMDGSGSYTYNSIDLNERVHNYNGVLGCDVPN